MALGLGPSWRTSVIGIISLLAGILGFISDTIATQGLPQTAIEWVVFAGLIINGIGHLFSKDTNVSNAERPRAEAVAVPPPPAS